MFDGTKNSISREETEMKSSRKQKRSKWKSIKKGVSEFQEQSRKIFNDMVTKVRQNSSKRRATFVENINITPDREDGEGAEGGEGHWAVTRRSSSFVEDSTQLNHSFVSMDMYNTYETVAVVHDMQEEAD